MKTLKKTLLSLLCCTLLAAGSAGADPSTGHGPGLMPASPPTPCTTSCGD